MEKIGQVRRPLEHEGRTKELEFTPGNPQPRMSLSPAGMRGPVSTDGAQRPALAQHVCRGDWPGGGHARMHTGHAWTTRWPGREEGQTRWGRTKSPSPAGRSRAGVSSDRERGAFRTFQQEGRENGELFGEFREDRAP